MYFTVIYLKDTYSRSLALTGLLCDLLWSDPDKDVQGWGENDRGVSFTFGADVVSKFLNRHDLDLICRAHQVPIHFNQSGSAIHVVAHLVLVSVLCSQVVEDGYEFFAKRQLVTLFSAPNYCGEFDNAGGMMSVDESLMCSFQVCYPHTHTHTHMHCTLTVHSHTLFSLSDPEAIRKEG